MFRADAQVPGVPSREPEARIAIETTKVTPMTTPKAILSGTMFLPIGVAALALGACVGDPRFPAGNDHDGNTSLRAVKDPTAMVTTDEMMEPDLLQPRESEATDADAYPELGVDPSYEPVREAAAVAPMSQPTAAGGTPTYQGTYPGTTYPTSAPVPTSAMATSDSRFTQQAMSSSATEIALARIALIKAQSEEVRDFARQMLDDHRRIAIDIDDFALQRGYLLNWTISAEHQATIDHLQAIDPASFDQAYMEEMVEAHEKAAAMMQAQSSGATETAVLARDTLPTVEHHLEMARALEPRV